MAATFRPRLTRPTTPHTGTRRGLAGIVLAAAALALSACSANIGQSPAPEASLAPPAEMPALAAKSGPVKIAMLLPLAGMGPTAAVAKSMKQAGEMALFERDNPNIQLLVRDDGGTPEGARQAAEQATRDGAEIILGPLFSQSVSAAAPVARAAKVPVIAFSNDPRTAGNGVYLMSFLARPEVERIVAFAGSRDKRRFAALIPADAYGDTVEPVFRQAVASGGGTLVHLERYPLAANGMLDPVKRISEAIKQAELAGSPVDALFLPGGADSLPQIAPLLAYNGIDPAKVKLLGTGVWDFPNVGREQMLAGAWYPSPDPRGWQDFSARFARNFGSAPPRVASLAYDAVSVAVSLSAGTPGQRYTAALLSDSRGFAGVDGTVTFASDGLSSRGLAVLEIQTYGNTVIDAAPSFAGGPAFAAGAPPAPRYNAVQSEIAPRGPAITGSVDLPPPR